MIRNQNVLLVIQNQSLRSTIFSQILKHTDQDLIYECDNEKEALWKAMKSVPDVIITSYHERQVNSFELIFRLRKINPDLVGYIIYDPESEEYEENLLEQIKKSSLLSGISALKQSDFFKKIQLEFYDK